MLPRPEAPEDMPGGFLVPVLGDYSGGTMRSAHDGTESTFQLTPIPHSALSVSKEAGDRTMMVGPDGRWRLLFCGAPSVLPRGGVGSGSRRRS